MASNVATIIADYREKCARLLQNVQPTSAEHHAYSQMLQSFDRDQTSPPTERVIKIAAGLAGHSRTISAIELAPPEIHALARDARAIVRKWALDFIHDTRLSPQIFGL